MAALLVVMVVTLMPLGGRGHTREQWCVVCGMHGLRDLVSNIMLFVPLGVALAALGWRVPRVAAAGVLLSGVIETLQVSIISGRDSSFGDVVGNGLGALLGALLYLLGRRYLRTE